MLRKTHPNFYLTEIITAGWYLFVGTNLLLVSSAKMPFSMSHDFAALLFLAVGAALAIVIHTHNGGRNMKPVILAGMALCFIWAVGYLWAYFQGTVASFAGAILFGFQGAMQIPPILEPSVNPATREEGYERQ